MAGKHNAGNARTKAVVAGVCVGMLLYGLMLVAPPTRPRAEEPAKDRVATPESPPATVSSAAAKGPDTEFVQKEPPVPAESAGVPARIAGTDPPAGVDGKSVAELRRAGDVQGLVAKLKDGDGHVRGQAAVALSGVVPKIEDATALKGFIPPLIDVTLRDTHATVREYAGRALMNILQRVDDQAALALTIQPLIDMLTPGEVDPKRRGYAAVALWYVVPKVDEEAALKPVIPRLIAAALNDPDAGVREYAGRPLKDILARIEDQAALTSAIEPLVGALEREEVRVRTYAAVVLPTVVARTRDPAALKGFIQPLVAATLDDGNAEVREYAGRALMNVLKRVDEEAVLNPVVEPLARALAHEQPRTRRYAAVALAALVPRVKDEATLRRAIPLLTAAQSKDPDPKVRECARRALSNALGRLEEKKLPPKVHSF